MPATVMQHEIDPACAIWDSIGDISGFEVVNNQVLVGVYQRPDVKTKSGLYLADTTRDEDRYQSKVGLIVKLGPSAYDPQGSEWFRNFVGEVGDWIVFKPSDGWALTCNGVLCRMLIDEDTRARITHPDMVY